MTRILVVDDSAVDRRLVGAVLEQNDEWTIDFAKTGREALEKIEENYPDAIVADLQMPEMNGLELVKVITRRVPVIPVILITSCGSEEVAIAALKAGASSYSPKTAIQKDLMPNLTTILSVATEQRKQERVLMRRTQHSMSFVLENDNSLIGPLVEMLQSQLKDWDEADRLRIGIALDESFVNAMYHGNLEVGSDLRQEDERQYYELIEKRCKEPPYCDRRIKVEASFGTDWMRVSVHDEGPGFDPTSLPDPTDPANLERVSGRGLLLIQTFMDKVEFNEQGNRITLFKKFGAPEAS